MAGNLDLNVVISASFEKLKKGMADAVNVVKGGSKKMEQAAEGSKQALEKALGGENLRVKRRELTQTINEQRSILTSFKQDLINLENKLAQTSKGDLMRQKALKNAIAGLKVEIKDQEAAVRQLSEARAETNFSLEEGSRRAEQSTQAMEALSRAVNAGAMATLLLAGDNDKLSKVMRGVQVTMALASAGVALYNLAQRQNEIFTAAATAAQRAYAFAVGTSTGAMKAFRIALAASGIGLIVIALGSLIGHFTGLGDAADEAANKVIDARKKLENDYFRPLDNRYKIQVHNLKMQGATVEQLQAAERAYYTEKKRLIDRAIQLAEIQQKSEEETQSLIELKNQVIVDSIDFENSIKEKAFEDEQTRREEDLKDLEQYLKDKRALEQAMQENLTDFLQKEEEKRLANLSARRRPRAMTEADLAPGMPAAALPAVLPGAAGGPFDIIAESADNASQSVVDFANNFRNATRGLAIDIRNSIGYNEQWAASLQKIEEAFNQMLNALETQVIVNFAETMGKAIAGELGNAQDFFQGFASALVDFLSQFGKLLIAEGIAIEAAKAAIKIGDGATAIIAGAALVASAAALKAFQNKGIPAFADGGIVSGPTLGLIGEYPGARTNPEVIAPLDKLQSMINTGQGGNFVAQTKFDGRDLWLAVNRYEKDKARG